jgi:hypothetical protein
MLNESSPGWREGLGVAAEFADAASHAETEGEGSDVKAGVEGDSGTGDSVDQGEADNMKLENAGDAENKPQDGNAGSSTRNNRNNESERELGPRAKGEYERRRGWRVDQGTMDRFRKLVAEFKGTQ